MVSSSGGNGKQSDSGSILGIEMTGFPNRLNVGYERGGWEELRGFQDFGLSNYKKGVSVNWNLKDYG